MVRPSVEDERRGQIIAATRRVMADRGVLMLRVADVARAAGVSPGIVHYYFTSKDDLLRETFDDNFEVSFARRVSILNQDLRADEKLDALIVSYLPIDDATKESWHVWVELWAGALQDPKLREINDAAYAEWRTRVSGVIAEGIAHGIFATDDAELCVNQLISMIDGLAVQVILGSSTISANEMQRICRAFVANTLLASSSSSTSASVTAH